MPTLPHDGSSLPEEIEEEVLRIVDGDEERRDDALRAVLEKHGKFATVIRRWLVAAGVPVPATRTTGGGSNGDGDGETLPIRIGAYVLEEVLGRGGFGTVYRAEQQEPIRRPVAIKVLNPGMDSREILGRFAAEREALNRMDHPGIARLLDAGSTPKGRPFFVMELVQGPTLASHCRKSQLPLRERLALFLLVLDAMQHAHQKAVLHRDLSSNNVLIAGGQPKIIDFGIAKSLSDPLLQGGAMTFQGTLMGTPEFMSPEQAAGRVDVDTRTDVYALGVQLYELLTDQMPIPGVVLRSQGLGEMANVIARHQPLLPSLVAPKERRAALRGDLDAIATKAIAKSRDERYGSVAEFASDIRRHLADEPVQVAVPTTWYRLCKFVRRNRAQSVAVAVVAAGLLTAVGGLSWGLWQARQATRRLEQANVELAAKADAGFRLLANEERLAAAIAAERALPPPWPENVGAYDDWLARHGDPLVSEIAKVDERLASLANARAAAPGRRFADPANEHLDNALRRLAAALVEFTSADGPYPRVVARRKFAKEIAAPAQAAHDAAWATTIKAVKASDGVVATAEYRGLDLERQPGLVPLGLDRRTMLFEFLDLLSHPRGAPLPVRDATTGSLVLREDTGIVFVLVPGGSFRLGARRGDPGMPGNDDDAGDDELNGELVALDEFLIARTELTNAQWQALGGEAHVGDPALPLTHVSWIEATALLARAGMRLPTEAQWEYACRGGAKGRWCNGDDPQLVPQVAHFGPRAQPTGRLLPNGFGLFDVHGNVAEWCADEYLRYGDVAPRSGDGLRGDPTTPPAAPRVVRGGSPADPHATIAARTTARAKLPGIAREPMVGVRPVRIPATGDDRADGERRRSR